MFSINIYLKLALIALCLVGGVLLAIFQGFWYAFPILLIGILLLASYLLLGTIQSAAKFIQTMDFEGAEKRLGESNAYPSTRSRRFSNRLAICRFLQST